MVTMQQGGTSVVDLDEDGEQLDYLEVAWLLREKLKDFVEGGKGEPPGLELRSLLHLAVSRKIVSVDSKNMSPALWRTFPKELLILFLARLPLPDITRLRSLSKEWNRGMATVNSKINRENQQDPPKPPQRYPSWLLALGAETLPFGTLFIELFFIMSSIWMGRVYYVFGFLFVVLILLIIVCSAEVALVLTYMHLCVEDHRWWWKSFFASGSVALYVFLYSINYLVFDLHSLSGPVSAVLYVGYSLLMVIAILFATGTVGFLTSFYFVHYLFSSVKID